MKVGSDDGRITEAARVGVAVVVAVLTSAAIVILFSLSVLAPVLEDIEYARAPSAARAYEIAQTHFNAVDASEYDILRAEYYFREALRLDPSMPLVRHELARIAFLRGLFSSALWLIDEEIRLNPEPSPSSYYMRALIKGFSQDYLGAVEDYETYFALAPANWGAINDYAWVLLKASAPSVALEALEWGLREWPNNPWLLNSTAIALFELGRYEEAREAASRAAAEVEHVTRAEWLYAYPGNDPLVAGEGLAAFQEAVRANLEKIEETLEDSKGESS
ncbi:MAG TPA: hypothetical protein VNM40_01095 [Candidatus Paceibacterota bacterium]|nr:hypothetical protein [Candidatus Paceibacterota bacterium]